MALFHILIKIVFLSAMAFVDDITDEVETILSTEWNVREGNVIPAPDTVALADGAVKLEATFLYADLAGSSVLAQKCPWSTTAKIIRAYLDICTRIIRAYDGEIRSFDGDRVMGVFKSSRQNTNAVKCAREIDWMVHNVLNPKAKRFDSIKNNSITIKHCIGVDTGEVRAVRAGIRNNNDLIWIGKAPSFAAKLSDIRDYPNEVFISSTCYSRINEETKIVDGKNIWTSEIFRFAGEDYTVYKTTTLLKP